VANNIHGRVVPGGRPFTHSQRGLIGRRGTQAHNQIAQDQPAIRPDCLSSIIERIAKWLALREQSLDYTQPAQNIFRLL